MNQIICLSIVCTATKQDATCWIDQYKLDIDAVVLCRETPCAQPYVASTLPVLLLLHSIKSAAAPCSAAFQPMHGNGQEKIAEMDRLLHMMTDLFWGTASLHS